MPPAPARYLVRLTLRASEDLQEIFDYIAAHSPQNAAGFIGRLLDAIDGLDILPHRYPVSGSRHADSNDVRSMPVGNYLVLYSIDDFNRAVHILNVRHGARRP